jgi:hypothetical protein
VHWGQCGGIGRRVLRLRALVVVFAVVLPKTHMSLDVCVYCVLVTSLSIIISSSIISSISI